MTPNDVVLHFESPIASEDGTLYRVTACGHDADGRWDGWLEFEPLAGGPTLRTDRETTQPNRDAIAYWASGLSAVYLEGAMARATSSGRVGGEGSIGRSRRTTRRTRRTVRAPLPVLDPFAVYAEGEEVLRQALNQLGAQQLVQIIRRYALCEDAEKALLQLHRRTLVLLILAAVREPQWPSLSVRDR